jgi:hypothetical protein
MALPGPTIQGFWNHSHDFTSDPSTLGMQFSPTTSTTDSFSGNTPPVQTPPSESDRKNSQNGAKISQKDTNANQARASVAVACVPCRSRHLKCDGGVRCSRCRTDNVDCTYIKSRRGWKGKRKNKDDAGGPVNSSGVLYLLCKPSSLTIPSTTRPGSFNQQRPSIVARVFSQRRTSCL